MKIIFFFYIFALYILCSRGILFQHSPLLHCFLFSVIFYFSIDFIYQNKEFLTEKDQANVEMNNVNSLVNKLNEKTDHKIKPIDVVVNDKINYTPAQDVGNITETCMKNLQELENYKMKVNQLKDQLMQYDGLGKAKVTFQNTINNLNEKETKLNEEKEKLNTTLINKDDTIATKEDTMAKLAKTIVDLSGNVVSLNENINNKSDIILKNAPVIESGNEKIKTLTATVNEETTKKENLDTEISTIKNKIRNLEKEIQDKIIIENNNKKTIGGLTTDVSGNITDIKNKQIDIYNYKNELNDLNNNINQLKSNINNANKNLPTLIQENKTMQNELPGLQNQYASLQSEYTNLYNTYNKNPDGNSTSEQWLKWLCAKCPPNRGCFANNWKRLGNFVDDFDGKGTSFQFKKIGRYNTWTVANSWTNPNPYVSNGSTVAPMKYVKRYV
jgi:uncharacterized protein (DUF3084 family)